MAKPRRRRSAEEARTEILAVAEALLIERGAEGVKVLAIAERTGLAHSNILHHFGSVAGIHFALVERMLAALAAEIGALLAKGAADARTVEQALDAVFRVLSGKGYARLIAWIALSGEAAPIERLRPALAAFAAAVQQKLAPFVPARRAKATARRIVRLIAAAALGEGLVGPILDAALGKQPRRRAGMSEAVAAIILAASADPSAPGLSALKRRAGRPER